MPSALVEYLIGELKSINFHLYGSKVQKTYLYIYCVQGHFCVKAQVEC